MQTDDIPHDQLSGPLRRPSVKKNVAAIHVSGKLTLLQRKLSNVLLLNAYDHLVSRPKHQIDARTLCMMVGYNSNDMETLKASLRSLAETTAEWDMLGADGQHEWGVSALLSYAKLKGGICEYAYSPALAEKLHDPKVFALINLNIQRRFTSGHALALYENCYRFVRTGSTGWWPIDLFRRLMGVDGSAYYESFKHLNAKVIKPAVKEVNKTSNILLDPEFRKMGRQVSELRFRIRENPQLAMLDIDDGEGVRQGPVYQGLLKVGVSDRLARQWIAEHGETYVAEKLAYLQGRDGVKSPVRYLTAALRDDYKAEVAPEPSPEAVKAAETRKVQASFAEQQAAARDAELEAARRKRAGRMARIRELVAARSPTQRDADKRLFLARLSDDLERAEFQRLGWGSALSVGEMVEFWEELAPGAFDDVA
ncbi:MAG: replication initiation protein [Marinovum algicola]|uniref:Initiator Replication protein n=1 Tax=Marinovum algicola TaxID=42444 RepID=A0A975WDI0_9RHOB|nr:MULTISPECIES: replication initiation protein [Marinovum]MDD9739578.1 replication initiation protein [Marinovum sp. SP66]SEK01389.1 Initiator Replication protein [Marinovum algicola]SLN44419.1 Initiator Replication protein [Marinovum algicola]